MWSTEKQESELGMQRLLVPQGQLAGHLIHPKIKKKTKIQRKTHGQAALNWKQDHYIYLKLIFIHSLSKSQYLV